MELKRAKLTPWKYNNPTTKYIHQFPFYLKPFMKYSVSGQTLKQNLLRSYTYPEVFYIYG